MARPATFYSTFGEDTMSFCNPHGPDARRVMRKYGCLHVGTGEKACYICAYDAKHGRSPIEYRQQWASSAGQVSDRVKHTINAAANWLRAPAGISIRQTAVPRHPAPKSTLRPSAPEFVPAKRRPSFVTPKVTIEEVPDVDATISARTRGYCWLSLFPESGHALLASKFGAYPTVATIRQALSIVGSAVPVNFVTNHRDASKATVAHVEPFRHYHRARAAVSMRLFWTVFRPDMRLGDANMPSLGQLFGAFATAMIPQRQRRRALQRRRRSDDQVRLSSSAIRQFRRDNTEPPYYLVDEIILQQDIAAAFERYANTPDEPEPPVEPTVGGDGDCWHTLFRDEWIAQFPVLPDGVTKALRLHVLQDAIFAAYPEEWMWHAKFYEVSWVAHDLLHIHDQVASRDVMLVEDHTVIVSLFELATLAIPNRPILAQRSDVITSVDDILIGMDSWRTSAGSFAQARAADASAYSRTTRRVGTSMYHESDNLDNLNHYQNSSAWGSTHRMISNVQSMARRQGRRVVSSTHRDVARPFTASPHAYVPPARRSESLNAASATVSAKVLLGPDALQGESYQENAAIASEALGRVAYTTSVPPSSKIYRRLVAALQVPLQYRPKIEPHPAAATVRRAYMQTMFDRTRNGTIGMVSPSYTEWHMNPFAHAWYPDVDGADQARFNRPCDSCQHVRCRVLEEADKAGRICRGDLSAAIAQFAYARVDYLWMVNIEPNLSSHDVLRLMHAADIRNGFSIFSIDPRVIFDPDVTDDLTEQRHVHKLTMVESSFNESGKYTVPFANVRDLFSPIASSIGSLRRTLVCRAGSGHLVELQYSSDVVPCGMNPLRHAYYLIPVPHPTDVVRHLLVEREGFDRLLQLFRTTANRDMNAARIQLRQSNVTYSVSGSQLTPRLVVSATESELLAVWMTAYSEMCDIIASNALIGASKDMNEQARTNSILGAIVAKATSAANSISPLTGTTSSMRLWIQALQVDGKLQTLEAISNHAFDEQFGRPLDTKPLFGRLAQLIPSTRTLDRLKSRFTSFTRSSWTGAFTAAALFAEALILCREFALQSFGVALELANSIARCVGYPTDQFRRLQHWVDNIHRPGAKILAACIDSQNLPFQAACINIVESFVQNWNVDPELEALVIAERARFFEDAPEPPYTRFVLEIKAVLRSVNSRAEAFSKAHQLVACIRSRMSLCPEESRDRLLQLQKDVADIAKTIAPEIPAPSIIRSTATFALGGNVPQPIPLPMHNVVAARIPQNGGYADRDLDAVEHVTISQAYDDRRVVFVDHPNYFAPNPPVEGRAIMRTIERLPTNLDGTCSFTPIHDMMEAGNLAAFMAEGPHNPMAEPAHGVHVFSPDDVGCRMVKNAIFAATAGGAGNIDRFVQPDVVVAWRDRQINAPGAIAPVQSIMRSLSDRTIHTSPSLRYVAHIQGLAMGGKSKGVRSWISHLDMIVTPTNELKAQWEEELGKLDPTMRASVYTQHTALLAQCQRYVIVDEAYTFTPAHLQALRTKQTGVGFITIGDELQIGSVLDDAEPQWNPIDVRPALSFLSPVSFCPYDALYLYLRSNEGRCEHTRYFSGSAIKRGVMYQVSDDVVMPSASDLVINGLQASKARMRNVGIPTACTSHESQGSRSEYTFIHTVDGLAACPDIEFHHRNRRHLAVALTRSRIATIFITPRAALLHPLEMFDQQELNGDPSVFYDVPSGSIFDLVDMPLHHDLVTEHVSDPVLLPSSSRMLTYDAHTSAGAIIDEATSSAVPVECIHAQVDLSRAIKAKLDDKNLPASITETFVATGSQIPHNGPIQAALRLSPPGRITAVDRAVVPKIVNKIFSRFISKDSFFSMAHLQRPIIDRMERQKLIRLSEAQLTRSGLAGRFFPKNELAKKVSTIGLGNAFKTLSVTAQSDAQLACFMSVSDSLTHAWARSGRDGVFSPIGFSRTEVNTVLKSDTWTWELDISAQDSSHSAVHVAVFCEFLGMVADKLGLPAFAEEIRCRRSIADHDGKFIFEMGTGLGSGDAWTLIANCVMAVSTLVCKFKIPPVFRMMQVGDDCTFDRRFTPLEHPIHGSKRVGLKASSNIDHPSFTSYRVAMPDTVLPVRLRFLNKMAYVKRNEDQHEAYHAEMGNIKAAMSYVGMSAYAEALAVANNSDSMAVENILIAALHVDNTPYHQLPDALRTDLSPANIQILSRPFGCFGFAAANAVERPDAALRLLAKFPAGVPKEVAIDTCRAEKIPYIDRQQRFVKSARERDFVIALLASTPHSAMVILYDDHAVCVKYTQRQYRYKGDTAAFISHDAVDPTQDDFI